MGRTGGGANQTQAIGIGHRRRRRRNDLRYLGFRLRQRHPMLARRLEGERISPLTGECVIAGKLNRHRLRYPRGGLGNRFRYRLCRSRSEQSQQPSQSQK
jgi:hypothetical protein